MILDEKTHLSLAWIHWEAAKFSSSKVITKMSDHGEHHVQFIPKGDNPKQKQLDLMRSLYGLQYHNSYTKEEVRVLPSDSDVIKDCSPPKPTRYRCDGYVPSDKNTSGMQIILEFNECNFSHGE